MVSVGGKGNWSLGQHQITLRANRGILLRLICPCSSVPIGNQICNLASHSDNVRKIYIIIRNYSENSMSWPFSQGWMCTNAEMFSNAHMTFDLKTLIYEFDLDNLKLYLHTKNEVSRSRLSKVKTWTGQTHRQTDVTRHITGCTN